MPPTKKETANGLQLNTFDELKHEVLQIISREFDLKGPLNEEDLQLMTEAHLKKKKILIEAMVINVAAEEMGKLHVNGSKRFEFVLKHHAEILEAAQGKEYQPALQTFLQYDLNTSAEHTQKIIEIGFHLIAGEAAEKIVLSKPPEVKVVIQERPPRGLLERIWGGKDDG